MMGQPLSFKGASTSGHGCFPPQTCVGGSGDVMVNGIPALRAGDAQTGHKCVVKPYPFHPSKQAEGSLTVKINGMMAARIGDSTDCGDMIAQGSSNVFVGDKGSTVVVDGIVLPPDQNSQANYAEVVMDLGDGIIKADGYTNEDVDDDDSVKDVPVAEDNEPAEDQEQVHTNCLLYSGGYDFKLSENFTLKDLTIGATFAHTLKEQNGLTEAEIVCNLQGLAENVLEMIWYMWPNFRINSGFRTSSGGTSQHEKGQAVDIQWPGLSYDEYWARAQWIKKHLNYDQFLFEHGKSVWFHLSYNRSGNRSVTASNKIMTMYKNKFTKGLKRYR
ncbi:PAAR motif protein [Vibrio phage 1.244.A._10N.261.54.C3]|nr:PAAR motif protein [Vibrio phage 1.244.A._10N.261.54.C3]AUR98687.1 PAAR motif protein [Vibrio phage 1.255.O._10N.286.45.F1]